MGEPAGTGNGPCPLQAAACFVGTARCSPLFQGSSCSGLCCLLSRCSSAIPESPRLHFSSGDRPEQTLGQPGCSGWAVKDGEPCSGALRTSRCFKRSKTLLKSRSGFCLEQRRSNFPPSITAVNRVGVCCELKLRAETWGQQHPKIKSFRMSQVHFAFADPVSGAIHLPPPKSRPRSPGSFWMMVINSYCSLKPDHKFHSVIM